MRKMNPFSRTDIFINRNGLKSEDAIISTLKFTHRTLHLRLTCKHKSYRPFTFCGLFVTFFFALFNRAISFHLLCRSTFSNQNDKCMEFIYVKVYYLCECILCIHWHAFKSASNTKYFRLCSFSFGLILFGTYITIWQKLPLLFLSLSLFSYSWLSFFVSLSSLHAYYRAIL